MDLQMNAHDDFDDLALLDEEFTIPSSPFDYSSIGLKPEPVAKYAQMHVPEITEEDYAGEQLVAFNYLRKIIRTACNINTKWKDRRKALAWCFIPSDQSIAPIDFNTACIAMGARPYVIQARLQHQFFAANIPMPEPLPFLACSLPEAFAGEVLMSAWEDGLNFAREIWRWPGIRADIMKKLMDGEMSFDRFRVAAAKLEQSGHIGMRFGCWYFTARSHDRMSKRSFSWSKSVFD